MRDDERDLKAMFDEAAGSGHSVEGALSAVRPRIRRAHQRRVVARGGAGVLGLLVFGGLVTRTGRGAPDGQKVASTGQISLTDATSSS
ncbi:MAG TPA: hypothetical protein VK461_16240, partial [Acidimicrobiales bacterium]|nr:hypothetical protein [Acidimicrobiales bacterium]